MWVSESSQVQKWLYYALLMIFDGFNKKKHKMAICSLKKFDGELFESFIGLLRGQCFHQHYLISLLQIC